MLQFLLSVKAGTHWPNHWTSEVFGDTRTRPGPYLFGVFSCVGSFWIVICSDSTCKVWGGWLLAVWAIRFSDWWASYVTILIGGVLANQRGVWERWNPVRALFFCALLSVISCFHVAPTAYCISHKCRMYTLTVELAACWNGVFNATFLLNGSDNRQQNGQIKAVGCWIMSGRCVRAFRGSITY